MNDESKQEPQPQEAEETVDDSPTGHERMAFILLDAALGETHKLGDILRQRALVYAVLAVAKGLKQLARKG